ncbi:MAG: hypothetical protein A3G34_10430 [Candidatus Lindowbacteria bacterium RIFCSPLOWO2_12_FULL_62_27]|nr:MAG: hypothetical protein A3G34_10430 [Candidatus Lindowbacteria bacterium RIFCSPLOWO2_12_FULL_62_27]
MAPLVRRTWAPIGQTPILQQRTRSHQKVSMIAALCVPPKRDRVRLYFRLHPNANLNAITIRAFLRLLMRHIPGNIVLIWDNLGAHHGKVMQSLLQKTPRLHVFRFPPYAPELDPVEYFWSYLKTKPLANDAPEDIATLATKARSHSRSIQRTDRLLRSFVQHSPLSLRLR